MIDIHSHIIFGVDDGPCTIEQSISMVHNAEKAGIKIIVATPHSHENLFETERLSENYQEILYRIRDFGVTLKLGYEVFIHPSVPGMEKGNRGLTLDRTRYLLFELPFNSLPVYGFDVIVRFRLENVTPIIAHPERNRNFLKNFNDIAGYTKAGSMVQVDAASILGVYGREVRDFVKKLMKCNRVDFVASNAHCAEDYAQWFLAAYREVSKWVGEENARRLFKLDMLKSALTILFIVLLGDQYGVVSMAAGILLAYILQFVLLNFFLIKLLGFRFKPKRYKLEKELQRNIMFVVISQVSTILSQYVAIYLISGLSEGVYTALSYSDRLYNIFVLVFAGQVSTVLGINMIEMYAKGQFEKLNREYLKYMKVTMTILLPICFIMAIQAPLVISILLERGNFISESVQLTSIFFKYSILTVPLLLLDRLIVRLIIAKQIMHISFIWNVISKILSGIVVFIIVNHIDYRYYGLGLLLVQFVYIILINIFMVKNNSSSLILMKV